MKREGSSYAQFAQRIPVDLRERMVGMKLTIPVGDGTATVTITPKTQIIRFSLRTREPSEVKDRQAGAAAYLEQVFRSLRENVPVSLSHRQAVALSGILYRSWASDPDDHQRFSMVHTEHGWVREDGYDRDEREAEYASAVAHVERLGATGDAADIEQALGPIVDRLLLDKGIVAVDMRSRLMILEEFRRALQEGLEVAARKAGGDYSPDPKSERFPEWRAPGATVVPFVSLRGLVETWWKEAQAAGRSQSTYESYRKAVDTLAEFLGHDDAARVSADDVIRFKDHLLATPDPRTKKPRGLKTVKDSYLSGLRSVFNWAVANRRMASNPASGITTKLGRKARVRDPWFSVEEIRAILSAALAVEKGPKEPRQRHALKRWVPWLCAYTGARVGEMVQLRKQDVRHDRERWVITITPEAGRVKDSEHREVPLHPHLVELGFPAFVADAPDGHLFMWSGEDRGAWRSAKNRLTDFIRTIVTDPNVQPSHGWRHTFKTIGSEAGIQDKVLDAICGHAPRTVGEGYGGVTIVAKTRAMERFPRFAV